MQKVFVGAKLTFDYIILGEKFVKRKICSVVLYFIKRYDLHEMRRSKFFHLTGLRTYAKSHHQPNLSRGEMCEINQSNRVYIMPVGHDTTGWLCTHLLVDSDQSDTNKCSFKFVIFQLIINGSPRYVLSS